MLFSIASLAQNTISYSYDDAGNRTSRMTTVQNVACHNEDISIDSLVIIRNKYIISPNRQQLLYSFNTDEKVERRNQDCFYKKSQHYDVVDIAQTDSKHETFDRRDKVSYIAYNKNNQ